MGGHEGSPYAGDSGIDEADESGLPHQGLDGLRQRRRTGGLEKAGDHVAERARASARFNVSVKIVSALREESIVESKDFIQQIAIVEQSYARLLQNVVGPIVTLHAQMASFKGLANSLQQSVISEFSAMDSAINAVYESIKHIKPAFNFKWLNPILAQASVIMAKKGWISSKVAR